MRSLVLAAALALLSQPAAAAERIVTLAPHLAELVCAAGGCEKLVGVVKYTDYPANAATKPLIGDALNLNYEQLLALRPDLVLAWDGGTSPQTLARLKELQLRVEPVRIRSLRDIATALDRVGHIAGSRTASTLAVNLFYRRYDALAAANAAKPRIRVMYQIETDPVYTVTARSPINEAMSVCSGENVFAALPHIAPTVSVEAVVAADPDVVIYSQQDDVQKMKAFWAKWPQAKAQRLGNLYPIDGNLLDRQSPRLLDGVEQLCAIFDRARMRKAAAR